MPSRTICGSCSSDSRSRGCRRIKNALDSSNAHFSGGSCRSATCKQQVSGGRVSLDEAGLVGEHDGLDPVAEAELLEDVGDVGLDGCLADEELLPDLVVGQAAGDEPQNIPLARGEFVELF